MSHVLLFKDMFCLVFATLIFKICCYPTIILPIKIVQDYLQAFETILVKYMHKLACVTLKLIDIYFSYFKRSIKNVRIHQFITQPGSASP